MFSCKPSTNTHTHAEALLVLFDGFLRIHSATISKEEQLGQAAYRTLRIKGKKKISHCIVSYKNYWIKPFLKKAKLLRLDTSQFILG